MIRSKDNLTTLPCNKWPVLHWNIAEWQQAGKQTIWKWGTISNILYKTLGPRVYEHVSRHVKILRNLRLLRAGMHVQGRHSHETHAVEIWNTTCTCETCELNLSLYRSLLKYFEIMNNAYIMTKQRKEVKSNGIIKNRKLRRSPSLTLTLWRLLLQITHTTWKST